MFPLRKHHGFVPAFALLVACTFSSACTAWHTTSLEPQRFSADTSPARARLTLRDGTQLTATHPVLVGDSLVWVQRSGEGQRDSARSVVLATSIRQVQVREADTGRSIGLLVVLGGLVGGIVAILHSIAAGLSS